MHSKITVLFLLAVFCASSLATPLPDDSPSLSTSNMNAAKRSPQLVDRAGNNVLIGPNPRHVGGTRRNLRGLVTRSPAGNGADGANLGLLSPRPGHVERAVGGGVQAGPGIGGGESPAKGGGVQAGPGIGGGESPAKGGGVQAGPGIGGRALVARSPAGNGGDGTDLGLASPKPGHGERAMPISTGGSGGASSGIEGAGGTIGAGGSGGASAGVEGAAGPTKPGPSGGKDSGLSNDGVSANPIGSGGASSGVEGAGGTISVGGSGGQGSLPISPGGSRPNKL